MRQSYPFIVSLSSFSLSSVCCARHKGVSGEDTGPALLGSGGEAIQYMLITSGMGSLAGNSECLGSPRRVP